MPEEEDLISKERDSGVNIRLETNCNLKYQK
jgi:hypothetical protein